jgi:ABC-2 type transport system permease protein
VSAPATTPDPAAADPTAARRQRSRAAREAREAGTQAPGILRRAADVWHYRELLGNFVRKELKVKYKNSVLGFVWSLLNPMLYLVVFYVVFQVVLEAGIPSFPIFFLAGLLPWTLFSTALGGATTSIVANAGLVGKVWFPREILPLAAIGAAFVHFLLQMLVLVAALAVFRFAPAWGYLPLVPLALGTLLVLVAALSVALAAVNVYWRDTQHLLELVLLAWFWLTPIVYPVAQIAERAGSLYLLNPVTSVVLAFQRALYGTAVAPSADGPRPLLPDAGVWWYARNLGIVTAAAVGLLVAALWLFGRLEDNLAEEL